LWRVLLCNVRRKCAQDVYLIYMMSDALML
jgi:hypothetical protein